MKMRTVLALGLVGMGLFGAAAAHADSATHRIGVNAIYWKTLDNVADDVAAQDLDESGVSYQVSYQYVPTSLLRLEGAVEFFPTDFAGGDGQVWAPQGFILAGLGPVVGGVGIGVYYADGSFAAAPFYMARLGLEFELLPRIFLAVDANYRVDDWGDIEELKTVTGRKNLDADSIRLGAAVHLGF
jgi:hypothetical protein